MSDSCDPMNCSPPGSSVHGILQARILEWVAISSPGALPRTEPVSPALVGGFFTTEPPGKPNVLGRNPKESAKKVLDLRK